jgi:hypothetical protein
VVGGLMLLAACTPAGQRAEPQAPAPTTTSSPAPTEEAGPEPIWRGPGTPSETGELEVEGFNAFVREERPDWATSPLRSALEFMKLGDPLGQTTTIQVDYPSTEGGSPAVVTITKDRLPDDSIRSARAVLTFRQAGPRWRLVSATVTRRCWPGRGHQGFSPALCI